MVSALHFLNLLKDSGVGNFYGVPDSLLKALSLELEKEIPNTSHTICANEGAAVASAVGDFLGSGKLPVVYLQNSGLGNSINPLLSIADESVYSIPILLLIGWRGEPGKADEPQHLKQGEVTASLLDVMGIPWIPITETDFDNWEVRLKNLIEKSLSEHKPVAVLVGKGFLDLSDENPRSLGQNDLETRESALEAAIELIPPSDLVVATTGMLGRELYELRRKKSEERLDFLNIGGMGHASSIALGLAIVQPERNIWVLDGDGAAIMHLGSLAVIGNQKPVNLKHLLFNNHVHDSVGGQPTAANSVDFQKLANSVGYEVVPSAKRQEEIATSVRYLCESDGPSFLEILVRPGSRPELGRPAEAPRVLSERFISGIRK